MARAAHRCWSVFNTILHRESPESSLEAPHLLFVQNLLGYLNNTWPESPLEPPPNLVSF